MRLPGDNPPAPTRLHRRCSPAQLRLYPCVIYARAHGSSGLACICHGLLSTLGWVSFFFSCNTT
ncbi:hypothetical protein C8R44DRAFT_760007 [Mycena epipterygia]|nr:hypothetical protein C8R44DRAFT_760007 [Mycena epipterygia]